MPHRATPHEVIGLPYDTTVRPKCHCNTILYAYPTSVPPSSLRMLLSRLTYTTFASPSGARCHGSAASHRTFCPTSSRVSQYQSPHLRQERGALKTTALHRPWHSLKPFLLLLLSFSASVPISACVPMTAAPVFHNSDAPRAIVLLEALHNERHKICFTKAGGTVYVPQSFFF